MRLSKKIKVELFILLIVLSIILRFQVISHEIGADSFVIHVLANSISTFGCANWWIHPTSIVGLYPYSYASAVPFLLSGISQCTNMNMESVIFLYCMILGIISIFTAYLMAGAIWNNDLFKFFVAFVFSTSQGIVTYTTWTVPARTLFVIILPLFIYLLLKTRTFKVRIFVLTFITLILLLATHHYIYFCIPITITYFAIIAFYKLGKYIKFIRIQENFVSIALLAVFFVMFLRQFFTRTFIEAEGAGSRYVFLFDMAETYGRYIGPLIFLIIGGYTYLLLKRNKKFEEWFLLLALVSLAPLLYIPTYMKWFIVSFASLFIGIALTNVAICKTHPEKRKYVASLVVVLLLLSVSFTGYYQHLHFLNDPNPNKRYMEERTYAGALWIKDNIDKDKNIVTGHYIYNRVLSISEVPTLTGAGCVELAYGLVDENKLVIKQIYSPTEVGFYFQDPYELKVTTTDWYAEELPRQDINIKGGWGEVIVYKFNLSYYVENKDIGTRFARSVQQTKDNLYDNGKIQIWNLD